MKRHLASPDRIIPDNTLFIESVRTKLSDTIALNSVIPFFQSYIQRLLGFLYFDYIKVLNHFFWQETFSQLYIRVLFHRNLF